MNKFCIPWLCMVLLFCTRVGHARDYSLAIQPILPPDKLEQAYAPLANYLSRKTGHNITIKSFSGFKSYWYNMKRLKDFDMVVDAAHFVDYRVRNHNYRVVARLPDTVSFSVVTRGDLFVFDVTELADYRVATMDAPAIGGLRLMQMFEHEEKEPMTIGSYDADDCIEHIREGRADAAVIPTTLVDNYENLNVVITTRPIPHTAFSVSPDIPDDLVQVLKKALLEADSTEEGRAMLKAAGLPVFINASEKAYRGYADILGILDRRRRHVQLN